MLRAKRPLVSSSGSLTSRGACSTEYRSAMEPASRVVSPARRGSLHLAFRPTHLGLEAGSTSPGAELRIRASCSRLAHKLKVQAGSRPAEWCHLDRSILNSPVISWTAID